MFVVSIKSDKLKKIFVTALILVLTLIGGLVYVSKQEALPASTVGGINMKATNNDERVAFFSQFGLEATEEPIEVKEIVIPTEFDDNYIRYNEIQKKQGLDLEPFKGTRVKYWSYEILNYPGLENSDGRIRGNLLIYNGIIIGGDVSDIALDGFMHTFFIPSEESTDLSTQGS